MVLAWRKWCSLCGNVPETVYNDLRSNKMQLEVVERCFAVSVRMPTTTSNVKKPLNPFYYQLERTGPVSVCPACEQVIEYIQGFTEKCRRTREMLSEVKRKKIRIEEELLEFRRSYFESPDLSDDNKLIDILKLEELIVEDEEDGLEEGEVFQGKVETELGEEADEEEDVKHAAENVSQEEDDLDDDEEGEYDEDEYHEKPQRRTAKQQSKKKFCEPCNIQFKYVADLAAHEKEVHPDRRQFMCEECGKEFRVNRNLQKHLKTHMADRMHQCPECPVKFKSTERLLRHQQNKHSKEKWVCSLCGTVLNTRAVYLRHLSVHSDERKYKCQICSKAFKRQKTLKDHLIIHSGLRPYKCPFCERTFVNGANCRSHQRKNHPADLAKLEASGMKEAVLENCRNIPNMQQLVEAGLRQL